MSRENFHNGLGLITTRSALYARLGELAKIEVKTEAERIEEAVKSREFWEWGAVEQSLLSLSYLHIESERATPLQNRIFRMARENNLQDFGGAACGH